MLGAGNDQIVGGGGDDIILGDHAIRDETTGSVGGQDRLDGGTGADRSAGGPGNDTLNGGTEDDNCDGQAGADSTTNCETGTP